MAKVMALVSFKIFPPHMGGQKGVALFYKYLVKHHGVCMACSIDNWEPIEAPYEVRKMLRPNRSMFRNLFRIGALKKWIIEDGIDCVIAEHSYTGWLALLLKKSTRKPFIIHSHNLESFRFRQMNRSWWKLYWYYERWIHRQADHSFFISQEDMDKAIGSFHLDRKKCSVVTYGIEMPVRIENAKEGLITAFKLEPWPVLHFNGTLDYEPNIEAVETLVNFVNPILQLSGVKYQILISGKRLPQELIRKVEEAPGMLYTDFAPDIELVYQGSALFLNAVTNNSGVKTKVIEALANGCTVVSFESGAAGLPPETYQNKMMTVPDKDWEAYAALILRLLNTGSVETPQAFYNYFTWTGIAAGAAATIEQISRHEKA